MNLPPELLAFAAGFPLALAHLGAALAVLIVFLALYSLTSDGQEIGQIRDGNPASALVYGLTFLSIALPIGKALTGSESLISAGLWMAAAGLSQVVLIRLGDLVLRGLSARIPAAALLGSARLALAWLLASALQG